MSNSMLPPQSQVHLQIVYPFFRLLVASVTVSLPVRKPGLIWGRVLFSCMLTFTCLNSSNDCLAAYHYTTLTSDCAGEQGQIPLAQIQFLNRCWLECLQLCDLIQEFISVHVGK